MSEIKEQPQYLENPYFKTLLVCDIKPDQLKVEESDNNITDPLFLNQNDENWQKEEKAARAKGSEAANRLQFALKDFIFKDNRLTLKTIGTDWKSFRFTRKPEVRKTFPPNYMSDILGTNVLIKTTDNKLIFVRRSLKGYKPGAASTVGGYPDTELDQDNNNHWDPFKTITREILEETSIAPAEIKDLHLTGIIYNKDQQNPNLAFVAEITLTEEELRSGLSNGQRKTDKEVDLKFIPDTKEELRNLSLWYALANSPAGISTMAFYGSQKYGPDFLNFVLERLERRSQKYQTLTTEQQEKIQQKASKRLSKFDSINLQEE